jgi:hypothetical protein
MCSRVFEFLACVHDDGNGGKGENENPVFLLLYGYHRPLNLGVDRILKKAGARASKSLYENSAANTLNQIHESMPAPESLTFSESPLSGKRRFKLRTINNFIFAIAIFIPFALLSAFLSAPRFWIAWVTDAVAIAVLFYLYRTFWNKRAIWIRCPTCRKKIATNTPWMCGSCSVKNEHVDDFPFVNRCESCGVEPKAYRCHHENCGKLIYLTKDELMRNFAYCINPVLEAREEEVERDTYEQKKRRGEYRLHLAQLYKQVELAEQEENNVKKKAEPLKEKTQEEKIKEHREGRRSKTIAAAEIYRNERKANEEKYKDDPEMLKMANEDLDDWYKGGDWERII